MILQQQPCEKYAPLLHVIIKDALGLAMDILNICELKVTNETLA
jgi:hypothetical protein